MGKNNFGSTVWEHRDSGCPRETVFDQMLITLVAPAEFTGLELLNSGLERCHCSEITKPGFASGPARRAFQSSRRGCSEIARPGFARGSAAPQVLGKQSSGAQGVFQVNNSAAAVGKEQKQILAGQQYETDTGLPVRP